jgi:hypothetical protein
LKIGIEDLKLGKNGVIFFILKIPFTMFMELALH